MNNTFKFTSYIPVFSLVWLMGEKLLGYHNTIIDWLPFTSLLWLLFIGGFYIVFLQTAANRGFNNGFKSLLKLSVYWLVGFAVIKGIYYQWVNPDYFNDFLLRSREWLAMIAPSDENFENTTQTIEELLQLPAYLALTTAVQLFFCLIYSLLFPAFSKSK